MKVPFIILSLVLGMGSVLWAAPSCKTTAESVAVEAPRDLTRFLPPKGGYESLLAKIASIEVELKGLNDQYDKATTATRNLQRDYDATMYAKYFAKQKLFVQQIMGMAFRGDFQHAKNVEDSIKESKALEEKIKKQSNALGIGQLKAQFSPIIRDVLKFSLDRRVFKLKNFSIVNISGLTGRAIDGEASVRFNVKTSVESLQGETLLVEIAAVFSTKTGKLLKAAVFEREDINTAMGIQSQAYEAAKYEAMIAQAPEGRREYMREEMHPRSVSVSEKYKAFRENTVLDRNLKGALNFDKRLRRLEFLGRNIGLQPAQTKKIAARAKTSKIFADQVDSVIGLIEAKRSRSAQDDQFAYTYFNYMYMTTLDTQLLPLRFFMYYYIQATPTERDPVREKIIDWSQQVQNGDAPIQDIIKKDIESGTFAAPDDLKTTLTQSRDVSTLNNMDYDRQYMTPEAQKNLTDDLNQSVSGASIISSSVNDNRDILGGSTAPSVDATRITTPVPESNPFSSFAETLNTTTSYESPNIGE